MDNDWLLAVLTLLKARMNLHWCFLAVILNNIFLWLKLLSVIVRGYFCDSQPSGACVMNLSLASSALPGCCTWGVPLHSLPLRMRPAQSFRTVFMTNSLSKKHLNALIKHLCSGLKPAGNYLFYIWSGQVI